MGKYGFCVLPRKDKAMVNVDDIQEMWISKDGELVLFFKGRNEHSTWPNGQVLLDAIAKHIRDVDALPEIRDPDRFSQI